MLFKTNRSKIYLTIVLLVIIVLLGLGIYFWDKNNVTIFDAKRFGIDCNVDRKCNDIVGINCRSEVDGPYYYVDSNADILSKCGGYCQGGCTNCPPSGWTCDDGFY